MPANSKYIPLNDHESQNPALEDSRAVLYNKSIIFQLKIQNYNAETRKCRENIYGIKL